MSLCRRKTTLFKEGFKLNIMTGAEMFLIVESPRQRLVWGSDKLYGLYERGELKPISADKIFKPAKEIGESDEHKQPRVVIHDGKTPRGLIKGLHPSVKSVLGYKASSLETLRHAHKSVKDLLTSEKPVPQLSTFEKTQANSSSSTNVTKIMVRFVSDEDIAHYIRMLRKEQED